MRCDSEKIDGIGHIKVIRQYTNFLASDKFFINYTFSLARKYPTTSVAPAFFSNFQSVWAV